MRSLKSGAALLAAACLSLVTGCATEAAHAGTPAPTVSRSAPAAQATVDPAGDAGGACQLLDWEDIQNSLGLAFTVAASSQANSTFTCVTETKAGPLPDLTLSVTPTTVDPTVFHSAVQPKGTTAVPNLGRVGYQTTFLATAQAGPGVEVCWLAGNARLLDLRVRLPLSATHDDLTAMIPRTITLARKVDLSSI